MSIRDKFNAELKQCRDFNRPKDDGIPLPTLYHATPNVMGVCKDGLLPRCDLDGVCGLGGGTDKLVSFTTDSSVAVDIAKDFQTAVKIANGSLDFANYCDYLNEHDTAKGMTKTPCDIMTESINHYIGTQILTPEKAIELLKKGYFMEDNVAGRTKEQWLDYPAGYRGGDGKAMYIRDWDDIKFSELDEFPYNQEGEDEYKVVTFKVDKGAIAKKFFRIFNYEYLRRRSQDNGRRNPVFWGDLLLKTLKDLHESDVGIIQAEGTAPEDLPIYNMNGVKIPFESFEQLADYYERNGEHLYNGSDEESTGFGIQGGLAEIRLARNRFNKVKVRNDLLQK